METFTMLGALAGGALALNALGFISAQVTDRFAQSKPALQDPPSPPQAAVEGGEILLPAKTVPEEETARYWWSRLFSPHGMLGVLMGPSLLVVLPVNSDVIARTFEFIFDQSSPPLMWLNLLGWSRELTMYDLYGVTLSVMEISAASVLYHTAQPWRGLLGLLALIALPSLGLAEVGASIYRDYKLHGEIITGAISGLMALGVVTAQSIAGMLLVDGFLVPLLLAVWRTITAPVWALDRWREERRALRVRTVRRPQPCTGPHPLRVALASPFAALECAVMRPLRGLDRIVHHGVRRLIPGVQP